MSALLRDFRHGIRGLRRSPGFTLLAVSTLALGIGATTAIFSLVDAVLFRPLPVSDPDRLVRIFARGEKSSDLSNSSYPVYANYRDQSRSFSSLAAYADFVAINLELAGGPVERVKAAVVTGNYFETLGVSPASGRLLRGSDDGAPGGVVAQAVALRRREYGVRMALGSPRAGILRLVLRRALAVSAAGLAAGLGLAFALAPLASSFLFGVQAREPAVFGAAALVLGAAALLASLHPAVRATRVDPIEVLRSE